LKFFIVVLLEIRFLDFFATAGGRLFFGALVVELRVGPGGILNNGYSALVDAAIGVVVVRPRSLKVTTGDKLQIMKGQKLAANAVDAETAARKRRKGESFDRKGREIRML